jgi:RNA polymerase sigma factor (TIGR02999 family)
MVDGGGTSRIAGGNCARGDLSRLLHRWQQGEPKALEELTPVLYGELRRLAGALLRGERSGHTLQATALVHEAYLRLAGGDPIPLRDRAHFLGMAAHVMRNVLVDHARRRRASKRGAGQAHVPLDDVKVMDGGRPHMLLALDDALTRLSRSDARRAQALELCYFGGLTVEETAEVIGVSSATIGRELRLARAWLRRELVRSGIAADPGV